MLGKAYLRFVVALRLSACVVILATAETVQGLGLGLRYDVLMWAPD